METNNDANCHPSYPAGKNAVETFVNSQGNGATSTGVTSNGVTGNGTTGNGVSSNDATGHGTTSNGVSSNDAVSNSVFSNGVTGNGTTSSGVSSNDATGNGVSSNDAVSNGVSSNDVSSSGVSSNVGNANVTVFSQKPDSQGQVPIAVCGMGMRLPGGIHNDHGLYDFLINKGDARSIVGKDRFNVDAYYSPHGKQGTICTKHGYYVNDVDLSKFDLSMFTLTSAEAEQIDPNQRLVLEVVREAFESAGETEWSGKNIGVYVGMFSEDWQDLGHKDIQQYNHYRVLGSHDFALPNRVSYEYNLKGPRYD